VPRSQYFVAIPFSVLCRAPLHLIVPLTWAVATTRLVHALSLNRQPEQRASAGEGLVPSPANARSVPGLLLAWPQHPHNRFVAMRLALILCQHFGYASIGFVLPRIDIRKRLTIGVTHLEPARNLLNGPWWGGNRLIRKAANLC
jgi:hypothetical protein